MNQDNTSGILHYIARRQFGELKQNIIVPVTSDKFPVDRRADLHRANMSGRSMTTVDPKLQIVCPYLV